MRELGDNCNCTMMEIHRETRRNASITIHTRGYIHIHICYISVTYRRETNIRLLISLSDDCEKIAGQLQWGKPKECQKHFLRGAIKSLSINIVSLYHVLKAFTYKHFSFKSITNYMQIYAQVFELGV